MSRPTMLAVAVALWWPAVMMGQPHAASAATQAGSAAPALPGEWIYSRSSRDVLEAVRATLKAAGLTVQHDERAFGALVTKPAPYDLTRWPAASALNLPPDHTPATMQFHIHVSPDLEPARLAVSAVLDTVVTQTPMRGGRARGASRFYAVRPLAASFVAALSSRLGVEPEPLAATWGGRAEQARRLLPPGLAGGCGVQAPAEIGSRAVDQPPKRTRYGVMPLYPEPQQQRGAGGQLAIAAELTEHGTVTDMRVDADDIRDDTLKAAAFGAAGLWRYRSAVVGGCPVPIGLVLSVEFSMSR